MFYFWMRISYKFDILITPLFCLMVNIIALKKENITSNKKLKLINLFQMKTLSLSYIESYLINDYPRIYISFYANY